MRQRGRRPAEGDEAWIMDEEDAKRLERVATRLNSDRSLRPGEMWELGKILDGILGSLLSVRVDQIRGED